MLSRSSLWVMNSDFKGSVIQEFSNSWLVAPVAWNLLFKKYLPEKVNGPYGETSYMSAIMFDNTIDKELNQEINNSPIQEDRVVWEMSNQQVFFTKDKEFIAKSIKNFLTVNHPASQELQEHIHERFQEVAEEILQIDENEHPYFIFKNTSTDDNVEFWFYTYDEDEDYVDRTLKEVDKHVTEFVFVENEKISGFSNNIDYFSKA